MQERNHEAENLVVRPAVTSPDTDKSTVPYRDVAGWRSDFFACPIFRSASSLRTESNTANSMQGGGVTPAVLGVPQRPQPAVTRWEESAENEGWRVALFLASCAGACIHGRAKAGKSVPTNP
jgi:hypothetical protein